MVRQWHRSFVGAAGSADWEATALGADAGGTVVGIEELLLLARELVEWRVAVALSLVALHLDAREADPGAVVRRAVERDRRDDRVSETGSLGEAPKTCGAGAGEGIAPRSSGWVTLTLRPGRYELVCNLPGHYGAGMYALLTVN